jgi:DNA-binding HxlR family transcriptional regulator
MEVSLNNSDWRVLRQVLRARRPARGSTLRLEMTRRTKTGAFLTALVRYGLLQVATPGETPFDATYTLTELGKHAAEYGIYEVAWEEYKNRGKEEE